MAQSHSQWQLQADILKLTGALDRDSVPALWAVAQQWLPSQTELECSLEEIERIDSAGMVMLIHLLEHAKNKLSYNAQFRAGAIAHFVSIEQR